MVMLWLRLCDDSCVNRGEADAGSLANGWRRLLLPAISVPGSSAVELVGLVAGASHRWSSCRAVIAWGMNRFAGALFAGDEDEARAGAANRRRRQRARASTPSRSPTLASSTRLAPSRPASVRRRRCRRSGASRRVGTSKRMLSTLLILADAEREDPAILTRPLASPIFITGLPRSGTTFLHGLLAEDPLNRAPRIWEAIYPRPEHRAAEFGAGRGKVAAAAAYLQPALARDQKPASDRGGRAGGMHRDYEPGVPQPALR